MRSLRRLAEESSDHRGMATTLTLYLSVWPRAYLLQVGDSRCYLLRDGELTQITRDQTMAQEMVDLGIMKPEQVAGTRLEHTLTSSIGGSHNQPTVTRFDMNWGHVLLLCSDGLTRHVSDDRIREVLRSMTSARQACETLAAGGAGRRRHRQHHRRGGPGGAAAVAAVVRHSYPGCQRSPFLVPF